MKKQTLLRLTLLSLMLPFAGCAIFQGGNVPLTTLPELKVKQEQKPTVSFDTDFKGGFDGRSLPASIEKKMSDEVRLVLEDSKYFSKVSEDIEGATIEMDVKFVSTGNPAAMIPAFITGLSLYTIPSWATENYDLKVNVIRSDGKSGEYSLMDSSTMVQWLPMIFAFPTHDFSVMPEIRKNMYRKVLFDMESDGFFEVIEVPTLEEEGVSDQAEQVDGD